MDMQYSVLMSVYKKEQPEFLKTSMLSMFSQTIPPDDFVLVCDGPLTAELDKVIDEQKELHETVLNVVRLPQNVGLGKALNEGIKHCKNDLVARMDSDDISYPDRCEKQLAVFEKHPELSIVGGIIEEFSATPDEVTAKRVVPKTSEEIRSFAKRRSPFNHPSVMYRRNDVLTAGNYPDVRYMQDYYLWIDMILKGMKGYNIQEPLVWMRADNDLFKRRSGKLYMQIQVNLFKKMRDEGFITYPQYVTSVLMRAFSSLMPNRMRKFCYKSVLRK